MIKRFILLFALFPTLVASVNVSAQASQNFQLDLDLIGVSIPGIDFASIELDLGFASRYMRANGAAKTPEGLMYPLTGTCFLTDGGGVLCNLSIGPSTMELLLDGVLNGQVTTRGPSGSVINSGIVRFAALN